jgi:hypothetical protein
MIGVAGEHFAPGRDFGSTPESQPGPEQKKDKRDDGRLDRHDALAFREQVNSDPGNEQSEDERDLFDESREEQGGPSGDVAHTEEQSEAWAIPAAREASRNARHEQEGTAQHREDDGQD